MSKNELENFLKPGDILLIVPPFSATSIPSYGLHLLQSICKQEKLTIRVLYASFLYSLIIGHQLYHSIFLDDFTLLGERLFAAKAFDLPPMKQNMVKLFDPGWVPDHVWQRKTKTPPEKIPGVLLKFRELLKSADWEQIESLSTQWVISLAEQVANMGFPVIGCTTTSGSLAPAVALLKCVKNANPNITTIIGGTMCDGEMAAGVLSLKTGIDYIFSGEGEITFPPFIKNVLAGNLPGEKIIYGEPVENLDINPLPDYQEYMEQRKILNPGHSSSGNEKSSLILYETSRGCWYGRCTFCGLKSKRKSYREKSPVKIIKDLKQLLNRYEKNTVWMIDNIMPGQYFKTLLPRIAAEIPSLRLSYEIKANLTLEQMLTLKKAGVTQIQPGIESLSPSLLKRMRKGVTVRENIALLRYARSLGIDVRWYLLFGLPGDQAGEYKEMLDILPLMHHLLPPREMIPLILHRFSEYYSSPGKFGISNLRPAEVYKDILPAHANTEKLVYQFAADYNARSFENPELIEALWEQFKAWRSKWEFYQVLPLDFLLPALHLEKKSPGEFVLHDTRGLEGNSQEMVLDRDQAGLLLTARPGNSPGDFQWALDARLGVCMDSWFIPLATANPDLLQEFERESN